MSWGKEENQPISGPEIFSRKKENKKEKEERSRLHSHRDSLLTGKRGKQRFGGKYGEKVDPVLSRGDIRRQLFLHRSRTQERRGKGRSKRAAGLE